MKPGVNQMQHDQITETDVIEEIAEVEVAELDLREDLLGFSLPCSEFWRLPRF